MRHIPGTGMQLSMLRLVSGCRKFIQSQRCRIESICPEIEYLRHAAIALARLAYTCGAFLFCDLP
jgi:hypothetical protein